MKSSFGKIVGYIKAEEPITSYQRDVKELARFLMKIVVIGAFFYSTC
jgi:hypothetical protein